MDLAASTVPCRTIGGDFYDYLDVGAGAVGVTLGDVAGKGPPAALLAAVVQSIFAAQAALSADPAVTMTRINAALMRRSIEARFATMFYAVLYPDGRLSYSNAGHEPPVIVGGAASARPLDTGGVVLGLFNGRPTRPRRSSSPRATRSSSRATASPRQETCMARSSTRAGRPPLPAPAGWGRGRRPACSSPCATSHRARHKPTT
jgi:hypothetical protein